MPLQPPEQGSAHHHPSSSRGGVSEQAQGAGQGRSAALWADSLRLLGMLRPSAECQAARQDLGRPRLDRVPAERGAWGHRTDDHRRLHQHRRAVQEVAIHSGLIGPLNTRGSMRPFVLYHYSIMSIQLMSTL